MVVCTLIITQPQNSGPDTTINASSLIFLISSHTVVMEIEPIMGLIYLTIGFVLTYLSLEVAWHYTACKVKVSSEKMIKPCLFKQVKLLVAPTVHYRR